MDRFCFPFFELNHFSLIVPAVLNLYLVQVTKIHYHAFVSF